jgi:son of sevenless-like protein
MNGIVGTAPMGAMYVRALYDYEADDRTSLSFHEGDVIQVITQLESGWWDGVINGVRGWFPSNYCQIITSPDDIPDSAHNGAFDAVEDDVEDPEIYDDQYDQDDDSELDGPIALPLEGTDGGDSSRADFWIPQATPDGRLFYYNMMTGDRSMELPLESPVSANETGPRDRMNVNIPDKTRPPPEMMARGLTQDEDDESLTSASEAEGDSSRLASRRSKVSEKIFKATAAESRSLTFPSIVIVLLSVLSLHRHPWIQLTAHRLLAVFEMVLRRMAISLQDKSLT